MSFHTCWSLCLQHPFVIPVSVPNSPSSASVTSFSDAFFTEHYWILYYVFICCLPFLKKISCEKMKWSMNGLGRVSVLFMIYPHFPNQCLTHITCTFSTMNKLLGANKMNASQRNFRKYYWPRSAWISCVEKLNSWPGVTFYCYIIGLKCIEAQVIYSRYTGRLYGICVLSHGFKFSTISKKSLESIISKPTDARSETSNAKHIFSDKGKLYVMLVQIDIYNYLQVYSCQWVLFRIKIVTYISSKDLCEYLLF